MFAQPETEVKFEDELIYIQCISAVYSLESMSRQ